MEYLDRMRRVCVPCGVVALLLLIGACSAQKSGSKFESRPERGSQSTESSYSWEGTRDRVRVQIDYLTPLSAIKEPEIFIYKEKRRLYVMQDNVLVRDYPVALGLQPTGDKEKRGDGKTPEGDFAVCVKEPMGRFSKSLGLDYPDRKHAERGYFSGLLSPAQFKDVLKAHEKRSMPPANTPIGERIAIHGGGAHQDWTDGCIALYDSDFEELFNIASVGTKVSIRR